MSAISLMNNQIRHSGKTWNMVQYAVKFATENPNVNILLCLPKRLHDLPTPPNITIIETKSMADVDEAFDGSAYTYVEIDHHIKDLTIVEQALYIRQLKEELASHQRKLEQVKEILGL